MAPIHLPYGCHCAQRRENIRVAAHAVANGDIKLAQAEIALAAHTARLDASRILHQAMNRLGMR